MYNKTTFNTINEWNSLFRYQAKTNIRLHTIEMKHTLMDTTKHATFKLSPFEDPEKLVLSRIIYCISIFSQIWYTLRKKQQSLYV